MTGEPDSITTVTAVRHTMRCGECAEAFGVDAVFCPYDGSRLVACATERAWASGDPLLGTVLDGRYEVLSVLGEGGMGRVYLVRHTSLERTFAMKVLRRDFVRDRDLCERFLLEARATASIKHPNVVAISDFGALPDGVPYFVMELLRGKTLAEVLHHGGAVPAAMAVRIALKIASGLGAAHAARVVHRDLKPENVFLVGAGGPRGEITDDVRVVDFGAARILGNARVTRAGVVFGTPHYMSPEQASGQPVDQRADVYALGIILYELLAGRVPFEADTSMGVLTQHMFAQPIPPSALASTPNGAELGALEDIVLRALEKKPENRYGSMDELATHIERVVRFGPAGEMHVGPRDPSASFPAAGGVAYPLANALELPTSDEIRAAIASRPPRRARSIAIVGVASAVVALLGVGLYERQSALGGGAGGGTAHAHGPVIATPADRAAPASSAATETTAQAPTDIPPPDPAAAPTAVRVTSVPAGATVWDGATRLGATPLDVPLGEAGRRVVSLRAPGFGNADVTLDGDVGPELQVVLQTVAARPRTSTSTSPSTGTPASPASTAPVAPASSAAPAPPRPRLETDLADPWAR